MTALQHTALLVGDTFLANQLGRDVRRVDVGAFERMGVHAADAMREALEALEGPAFVYARAPSDVPAELLSMLCAHGFEVIDTAVTLERSRVSETDGAATGVRAARPEDEEAVAELAMRALTQSRFHRDPAMSWDGAASVKAAWVRNYFRGLRGDAMVVAAPRSDVEGFLLAALAEDGAMVIDLVAVAAHARRRGLCRAMMLAAQRMFPVASKLRVGTQGSNRASLEAYRRMGFRIVRTELVLHAHVPGVSRHASRGRGVRCA